MHVLKQSLVPKKHLLRFVLSLNKVHASLLAQPCIAPSICSTCFFSLPVLHLSTSLTQVHWWLISFYKAILLVLNDLWVAKMQEADVTSGNSWVYEDSPGLVEAIKLLNHSWLRNILPCFCIFFICQLFIPRFAREWKFSCILFWYRMCISHHFSFFQFRAQSLTLHTFGWRKGQD